MDTTTGLMRRLDRIEQRVPTTDCHTCAERPVFTLVGPALPCPECGCTPLTFTIDIDRASSWDGDAA